MKKVICFDMDGTVANLYGVDNWLDRLRAEDATPYLDAEPMWDMEKLNEVLALHQQAGNEIRIITWLSMESSPEYKEAVREAKRAWLEKWGFLYNNFHGVQYGATKADSVRKPCAGCEVILIDDNAKVREGWTLGDAIDPTTTDIIDFLLSLLD